MGAVYIVSGPSGAGKSTITKAVAARHPEDVVLSVSATTRAARPGEEHGREYLFVSDAEFDRAVAAGEMLEWASVHGARYGTLRSTVEQALAAGKKVVLEIDVQGARSVKEQLPDAVGIFIVAPSAELLEERLAGRGTEDPATVARRLAAAASEVAAAEEFDAIVVNETLESAVAEVDRILTASTKTERTP